MKLHMSIVFVQIVLALIFEISLNGKQQAEKKVNKYRFALQAIVGALLSYALLYVYIGSKELFSRSFFEYVLISAAATFLMEGAYGAGLLLKRRKEQTEAAVNKWKAAQAVRTIVAIVVVAEVFVFNYQHILTINEQENTAQAVMGEGLESIGDDQYKVVSNDALDLIFEGVNLNVNDIYIDLDRYVPSKDRNEATKVTVKIMAEEDSEYYTCGDRNVVSDVEQSKYIRVHLGDKIKNLKLSLGAKKNDIITIKSYGFNQAIPYTFMWKRMAWCILGLSALYLFRPKSRLYGVSFHSKSNWKWAAVAVFLCIEVGIYGKVIFSNLCYTEPVWTSQYQYQELAHSMANGHRYLEKEVPQSLKDMENPYDRNLRDSTLKENSEQYYWDHAYYDGKYYVYFGVVPEIIFFLPYYLMTNEDLPTVYVIFVTGVLLMLSVMQLLRCILKKWFPEASFLGYLLMCAAIIHGMGFFYFMARPDMYTVPIIVGLLFAVTGIWCWMLSIKEEKVSAVWMGLGSLCIALVAGCRPQIVFVAFVAFPLFWEEIVRKRTLFSKKSIGTSIAAIVPFIAVAGMLMWYNKARFGSSINFGANYNLTVNDMTKGFFSLEVTIAGAFVYLIQPMNVGLQFPFVAGLSKSSTFLGTNYYEMMYGGLFMQNIILWAVTFIRKVKAQLKEKKLWGITVLLLALAFLLVVVDIRGGGVSPRYTIDFAWLFFLTASIVIFALEESYRKDGNTGSLIGFRKILLAAIIVTMAANFFLAFANPSARLPEGNASFYYTIYYAFNFWA